MCYVIGHSVKVCAAIQNREEEHEKNSTSFRFTFDCRTGGYELWLCSASTGTSTGTSTETGASTKTGSGSGTETSTETSTNPGAKTPGTGTGVAQVSSRDYSTTEGFAFGVFSCSSQDYREIYRNTNFTSAGEWFSGGMHGHG